MEIEEFLKLENPEKYDFSNDCSKNNDYIEKKGIKKFLQYKTSGNEIVQDPDTSSHLLQEIYNAIWPSLVNRTYMKNENRIASDTLTSAWAPVKWYIKNKHGICCKSALACKTLYENNNTVRNDLNENEKLNEFLNLYHAIGNYAPVPIGFNGPRSGYFASHDSWDLSLMKIYDFYKMDNGEILPDNILKTLELLHYDKSIVNVLSWLRYFGQGETGWKNFIETMCFQDFVNDKYEVEPFFDKHSWENYSFVEATESDINTFFIRVSTAIENRGAKLIQRLSEKY